MILIKTIALRFSDNYAPKEGMIKLHQDVIDKFGYVWYGKFGNKISKEIIEEQLKTSDPKILLIKSGSVERYWLHFQSHQVETPELDKIPEYYRKSCQDIKCWFKVTNFEKAEKNVLSKCYILSSGDCLSNASRHCLNPYFKIEYKNEN